MVVILIPWRDDYSVGAQSIDAEHKALVDRINWLYSQLMLEQDPQAVPAFFAHLINTISEHFVREERYMRERGYDLLPEHKEDYERLLDDIRTLVAEFDRSEQEGCDGLATRLDGWLSDHFDTHDTRLDDVSPRHGN